MEVLMKKVIGICFAFIFALVLNIESTSAQAFGTRVEAEIPFDFTVGKQTFSAGKYRLRVVRLNHALHSVLVLDSSGKVILSTTAIQNGSTSSAKSEMIFANIGDDYYLDTIRTPEAGYQFGRSVNDKKLARLKKGTTTVTGL